ncbi:DRTGG domain-containing protein [Ignavigranum ruoffiae]|uniref:DRTGG domain-containing protein n=1 Tax=Ignavigranum ruoffiae TaxID=89093 RepID=UPI0024ADAE15|nr:DRTGG domain-containing protein [Ignavigranum ruoffiae]
MSKLNDVINYIETLPIGERISVRGVARKLSISEGTVYRAIKQAESQGLVTTIERVGTIRIEKKKKISEMLTFDEIVRIIDGEVLGGEAGLHQHLNKFIIGAMTEESMKRYFDKNSMIIVGNRESVQELALNNQVAVLITGGFKTSQKIIQLANDLSLPLISCEHDTYTVASLINRSIINQEIKKEILTVNEIFTPIEETYSLEPSDTIQRFYELADQSGLSRFPVHHHQRLVGVVTAKDIIGKEQSTSIERVMTKKVVTVNKHTSVASVSYKMVWEDIEMIPVIEDNYHLAGVVSRQDVMKAMQMIQQQPQINNTFEDEIMMTLTDYPLNNLHRNYDYQVEIQPRMINNSGTVSYGILCEIITYASRKKLIEKTKHNSIIEKMDLNYFSHIQLGSNVQIKVEIFNINRRQALMQVDLFNQNSLAAKAIISAQIIDKG